ncbi:MAG: hypothetical protein KBC84_10510 [Proteobacteria bacterium]|jgi:hypothetical protein|nr:hypothetical protein [Pseudomonadota bacterium]
MYAHSFSVELPKNTSNADFAKQEFILSAFIKLAMLAVFAIRRELKR